MEKIVVQAVASPARVGRRPSASGVFVMAVVALLGAHAYGQASATASVPAPMLSAAPMVSPDIDKPGEPFSYFSKPTDEIGVMDAPAATEITPEGYLYTGYGELMFFAGQHNTPVAQRLKTLEKGHLPIVHYTWRQDGIAYEVTAFEATLDGTPEGTLVNFIRVTMRNESATPTRADFATGVRYQAEDNTGTGTGDDRFMRPVKETRLGGYRQIGEDYNADWEYRFDGDAFLRDGRMLYSFPSHPAQLSFTLDQRYNEPPETKPGRLKIQSTTPVGIAHYSFLLQPKEERSLDFRMPVVPLAPGAEADRVKAADFDAYKAKTIAFWEEILSHGMGVTLPEEKVVDTFKMNLIYDLIARDKLDGFYIQTVNKLHYHSFYLRDSSDILNSYELTGYPEIARQVIDFFPRWQTPDGNFLSQSEQYDGWGEALWSYGRYYRMTGDRAFAEQVFPSMVRAVVWLKQARAADPLHLMPVSNVLDNEYVPGHLTGYNFLALAGLNEGIFMADSLGRASDAADFRKEYNDYCATFLKVLDQRTADTGGYIPPALDGQKTGQDWGNLLGTYPMHTLAPNDPRIAATLKNTQARYQEGLITYGDGRFLHHYLTIKNTFTEVIRGDQEQAVNELYALLAHTSSTHAGFEFAIRPWGDRDFEGNLSPHGWFAAEYRALLRNMLVREDEGDLHLLSVLSPEWIGNGKAIAIENAPTEFGKISYQLTQPDEASAMLHIDSHWKHAPGKLVVHLPWFMQVASVSADGKPVTVKDGAATVPANTKEVSLHWARKADAPALSYQHAVDDYKAEYRKRYEQSLHGAAN